MTKGHNQDKHKQTNPEEDKHKKVQGQHEHLKESNKDKSPNQGRSSGEDPSGGTKGQNSVS
jgi:hypothetical protein